MTNRDPNMARLPAETVNSVLESITDDELLNKECHRYACENMDILDNEREFDVTTLVGPQATFYWELFSSRTRELVVAALTEL